MIHIYYYKWALKFHTKVLELISYCRSILNCLIMIVPNFQYFNITVSYFFFTTPSYMFLPIVSITICILYFPISFLISCLITLVRWVSSILLLLFFIFRLLFSMKIGVSILILLICIRFHVATICEFLVIAVIVS